MAAQKEQQGTESETRSFLYRKGDHAKKEADPAAGDGKAAGATDGGGGGDDGVKPALTRIISGGSGQVGGAGGDGTPQSRAEMERARRARYAKLQSATDAKAKEETRRRKKADAQERVAMRGGMQIGNFDTYRK